MQHSEKLSWEGFMFQRSWRNMVGLYSKMQNAKNKTHCKRNSNWNSIKQTHYPDSLCLELGEQCLHSLFAIPSGYLAFHSNEERWSPVQERA